MHDMAVGFAKPLISIISFALPGLLLVAGLSADLQLFLIGLALVLFSGTVHFFVHDEKRAVGTFLKCLSLSLLAGLFAALWTYELVALSWGLPKLWIGICIVAAYGGQHTINVMASAFEKAMIGGLDNFLAWKFKGSHENKGNNNKNKKDVKVD